MVAISFFAVTLTVLTAILKGHEVRIHDNDVYTNYLVSLYVLTNRMFLTTLICIVLLSEIRTCLIA